MVTVKQFAKQLISKGCSPALQNRLRGFHANYQIMHNRHFREPEMALIKSLVSSGDVVADIGANVGVYTNELSLAVGPKGKVYSFEPVKQNYEILTGLLRKAHLDNVRPFNLAIGSKAAECEIVVPEMSGFTGFYWAHLARPEEKGQGQVVKVRTLDELCAKRTIERPDFIKCDVEGAELEVLRGGLKTIRSQKPGWLIEVSKDTSDNVFSTLRDLGYRAFVLDGKLTETETYRDREFSNYFFLHPQSKVWPRRL